MAFTLAFLAGCTRDEAGLSPENVEYCVSWAWSNGREDNSRALSSLLVAGGSDLVLSPEEYPAEIALKCNGKEFTLTKADVLTECPEHSDFYNGYTSEPELKDLEAKKGVTATATIDDGDELFSETEDVELDGLHLKITMHHRKALIRFAFKLDPRYAKIRYINIKEITFREVGSDTAPIVAKMNDGGLVLTPDPSPAGYACAGYCYIDPAVIKGSTNLQLFCSYDIYDKDADFSTPDADNSAHLTRKDVVATNTLQLSKLIYSSSASADKQIKSGYYYDLNITLNPDYLYVLSDHDNKHMMVN